MSVRTLEPVVVIPDIASRERVDGPRTDPRRRAGRATRTDGRAQEPRERDDEEPLANADLLLPRRP